MNRIKYRLDCNNVVGFKESYAVKKSRKDKEETVTVILGLNKDFSIPDINLIKDNLFISVGNLAESYETNIMDVLRRVNCENKQLYYMLPNIVYVCEIKITYDKDKRIIKSVLNLYVPIGLDDNRNINLKCVTGSYPIEIRDMIINKLTGYVNFLVSCKARD